MNLKNILYNILSTKKKYISLKNLKHFPTIPGKQKHNFKISNSFGIIAKKLWKFSNLE